VPEFDKISNGLFQADHFLQDCDPLLGKYMATNVMYRGDIVPKHISAAIATIKTKRHIQFVDWVPTGFKIGTNDQPRQLLEDDVIAKAKRSAVMISNSTAISQLY